MKTFSILITTKDRIDDLKYTLQKIDYLINQKNVACIICDDGSSDNTHDYLTKHYKSIAIIKNEESKGLIHCRNVMLDMCTTDYAISLDDDAHFVSEDILSVAENYFLQHPTCGLIATRIFWGKKLPTSTKSTDSPKRVKGFVGCGHIWNMKAWKEIPNYPEWFVFYGEEEFASYQLLKKKWEIHYVPKILVHHRVDVKSRKHQKDYITRQRRSFRSGLYLYILFYPTKIALKKIAYVLFQQFKNKTLRGNFRATLAVVLAIFDVFVNLPKLLANRAILTPVEYQNYTQISNTKIYWNPK